MADRVWITIHHEKRRFAPRDDEMGRVIACPRCLFEKIWIRFFLKIFDTPRRPERFEVSFGERIIHAKFLMV
jgi:hypothetical protein